MNTLKFYAWGAPAAAVYTTLEPLREQISYKELLWWPIHNKLLVRQKDEEYWDMFGFDTFFLTNASNPTLANQYIENVASGRIVLGGDLNVRPVISTNYLWALRDNTRKATSANQYMTALKWEKFGT